MRHSSYIYLLSACLLLAHTALAEPDRELAYRLKASVVKVHAITASGGHGVGSGVVVDKDTVATNCHVLANSSGISISKFGDSISPTGMIADWRHDICLLKFQYLELPAVKIASAASLHYGEEVFSIGFPGGPPKPQTIAGKVRALYAYDDSLIVRTDAAFVMGSSGSPTFNQSGELVSLSTFKSPGKHAYFYSVPVEWIVALMQKDAATTTAPGETAFWDLPPEGRPYWMQVVQPYQSGDWPSLEKIARLWLTQQPTSSEAFFYLASALHGQGKLNEAQQAYERATTLQPAHIDAWSGLALLAQQTQQPALLASAEQHIQQLDSHAWPQVQQRLQNER